MSQYVSGFFVDDHRCKLVSSPSHAHFLKLKHSNFPPISRRLAANHKPGLLHSVLIRGELDNILHAFAEVADLSNCELFFYCV